MMIHFSSDLDAFLTSHMRLQDHSLGSKSVLLIQQGRMFTAVNLLYIALAVV